MFETLKAVLQVCQRACPHPLELLLPAEDSAVVSELMGRLTNTRGLINDRGWIKEHQKAFSALRLSWTMTPPCPASAASAWLPTLTDLQKSTLALHQHRVLLSHPGSITASGQIQATASGQAQEVQVTASGQIHMPKLMIDVHPRSSRLPEESQLPEESEEPAKKIIKVRSQAKPSLWKSQALTIAEVTKSVRELSSDIDEELGRYMAKNMMKGFEECLDEFVNSEVPEPKQRPKPPSTSSSSSSGQR